MFKVTKKPPTKMTSFSSVSIVGFEQMGKYLFKIY